MPSDVFCSEEIYDTVFFETKHFLAAYNINPIIRGHSLVIPKRHVLYLTELNDEELAALRETLSLLLPKLLKAFDSDSYNFSINAGVHAGMVINHLHFHIVPRSATDVMQGKLIAFYHALDHERNTYVKEVPKEVARLRKIFKYEPKQNAL